jgi:4'-phosphopantetheinyl transferase
MPLVLNKNIYPDVKLAIWFINESNQELLNTIGNNYNEANYHQRIQQANVRHFLASRIILTQLFPEKNIVLYKNEFNKPFLQIDEQPFHISITHSFDYAAVLVAPNSLLGIDLERIDPRIGRVKKKFMNEQEWNFAGEDSQIAEQTLIWSTKETLYKLYGQKELDFKENLLISPFTIEENGVLNTQITKGKIALNIEVQYQKINNYWLTYTSQNNQIL